MNIGSLPNDIIHEILSRLPAKSIARFLCVSKQWRSILVHSPYFTELLSRPRLFFVLEQRRYMYSREWNFYSSPQPQNPYHHKSLTADSYMTLWESMCPDLFGLTSGLFHFSHRNACKMPVIYNPSTGRYTILPEVMKKYEYSYTLLGFDPIGRQFKVLILGCPTSDDDVDDNCHQILTLGNGEVTWRTIKCDVVHHACYARICIDGVLYYLGQRAGDLSGVIVCFDVRSETFKFVDAECYQDKLINYKGKLGWIRYDLAGGELKFSLWVLEDFEKQEWSNYVYTLMDEVEVCKLGRAKASIIGVTAKGEIVLMDRCTSKEFYVYYFDTERNTLHSVEIEGLGDQVDTVYGFLDQAEDLSVNDAMQLKSSHGLNTLSKRPNPQEDPFWPVFKAYLPNM